MADAGWQNQTLFKRGGLEMSESLFEEENRRYSGDTHVIPLAGCPLCAHTPDFVEFDDSWFAECPNCGLILGFPYGYGSRLDLCNDWNRRKTEVEA